MIAKIHISGDICRFLFKSLGGEEAFLRSQVLADLEIISNFGTQNCAVRFYKHQRGRK